jgi:hypothetical protein
MSIFKLLVAYKLFTNIEFPASFYRLTTRSFMAENGDNILYKHACVQPAIDRFKALLMRNLSYACMINIRFFGYVSTRVQHLSDDATVPEQLSLRTNLEHVGFLATLFFRYGKMGVTHD